VVLIARGSARPVIVLKSCGFRKRAPSLKFCSSTPMMKRMMPFITNITPRETMTTMVEEAFWRR
jgi:hypothetical protein